MLVKLTDECLQNMDNGLPTICVFIDLKKAFDTISHERLLTKLYLLNIRDKALDLLKGGASGWKLFWQHILHNSDYSYFKFQVSIFNS